MIVREVGLFWPESFIKGMGTAIPHHGSAVADISIAVLAAEQGITTLCIHAQGHSTCMVCITLPLALEFAACKDIPAWQLSRSFTLMDDLYNTRFGHCTPNLNCFPKY